MRLREGLRFHDDTPVLARDAAASITRFAARDGFGQALMAATGELSAPDDFTIRFRLTKPFPHLPAALAGSSVAMPCIMPERLASSDPFRQVAEMVGSGPYRFLPAAFNGGVQAEYERFIGYVPRDEGIPSYTAGPKVAHFDRIEWHSAGDAATAAAALLKGEVDWLDSPGADHIPLLVRNRGVTAEVRETPGSIVVMRFNHLHPPFDNPAVRRALLGAIDQADVMSALAGTDRTLWRDRIGLFGPGSALANESGIEVLSSPRDYGKVKLDLAAAGYRGEPVVVLGAAGTGFMAPISQVGVDQLRKAGLNVDLQIMDSATVLRRRMSKAPPAKGGWNVLFTIIDCLFAGDPATNTLIRGDGRSGMEGWPVSPELEALRDAWLDAVNPDAEKRIDEQMQLQLWKDVPYIPMGHWVRSTAHRREIVDCRGASPPSMEYEEFDSVLRTQFDSSGFSGSYDRNGGAAAASTSLAGCGTGVVASGGGSAPRNRDLCSRRGAPSTDLDQSCALAHPLQLYNTVSHSDRNGRIQGTALCSTSFGREMGQMNRVCEFIGLTIFAASVVAGNANADEIRCLFPQAFRSSLSELIPQYEASTGNKVISDYATIGVLTTRIKGGEIADVAVVSDQQFSELQALGKIVTDYRMDVARLGIGAFVRRGASKPDISSVEAFTHTLLAEKAIAYIDPAAGAPSGIYMERLMGRLGIADKMTPNTKLSGANSLFEIIVKGGAEIGFIQITELLAEPRGDFVGPLPTAIQDFTKYVAGLVAAGKKSDAGKSLIAFIVSPSALAVMKRRGLEPPA